MSIVSKVDDRGRIKLPKHLVKPGEKLLVIPAGRRIVLIPIPPRPVMASGGWLKIDLGDKKASIIADEEAMREIHEKLRRRLKHAH